MSSRRRPLQPNAALAEMIARDAEPEGEPFGGFAGEMAPAREPSASAPPRPVIPPPPWIVQAHADDPDRDPPKESAA